MPDQPKQSANGVTKRTGWSINEAAQRLADAKRSAANGAAPQEDATTKAAPTSEQQPDGLDPEVTNLEPEESDAGGSPDEAAETAVDDYADEDDEAKDPLYRVKIGGEEVDVPLSKLLANYSRHGDYTKKTQALAEQRQAVEAQAAELSQRAADLDARSAKLEQYDTALEALQQVLNTNDAEWSKIDWDALEADDPIEAQKQWRRYQLHKERKAEAEAEAGRRAKEREDDAKAKRKEALAVFQTEIAKAFPHWSDQAVMTKEWGSMEKIAKNLGFSDAEIRGTTDPRIFRMLHMAYKYDRVQAAKASATSAAPKQPAASPAKVVHPAGARPATRAGATSARDAFAQFAKSRSINDAASAMRAARLAAAGKAR